VAEVPGVGGDLLGGVVLGDVRRLADTDAERDFKTTGLTHLVAVSGSHLVVVAAVAGWLLGLGGIGRRIRAPATVAVLGAYVVLSGVQPSAVRAWVMASAVAVAWFGGRRVDGGAVLSAAAGLVLLVSPGSAFDLGFQLSVSAVAGLVLFARLVETWLEMLLPSVTKKMAAPIALTLAATFSTFPLITGTFGTLSLVSPVANLVVGPLMSAVLVVGLAGLGVVGMLPGVGAWLLHLAGAIGAGAASAAAWMASWPRAAIAVAVAPWVAGAVCVGAGAALWAAWPQPTRLRALVTAALAAIGVAYLAIGSSVTGGAAIEVCDVGQGDAILVRDGPRAILVDTGPNESTLRAALGRAGVRSLDAVVITHLHSDHDGGLRALDGLARPKTICVPVGAARVLDSKLPEALDLAGSNAVRELTAGDVLHAGRITLTVVWPRSAVVDPATNEASVVVRADAPGFSALLTGDAENEVLEPLANDGSLGDIDVLKVGHHGSVGAVSPSLLRILRPEWALVSVGTVSYTHLTLPTN
jgi:competence protein ComEC